MSVKKIYSSETVISEENRIRLVYKRRKALGLDARYSFLSPAHLFMVQELERQILASLKRYGSEILDIKKILDVGCGRGFWIRQFIQWGARPENMAGIDLLPERTEEAKRLCPREVTIQCGNAVKLGFPSATFDIVIQSTVFTSILDSDTKRQIASEMIRVIKPDGLILWYDYRVNNPLNPDVRGVNRLEISRLFPSCRIDLRSITLAPLLVRLIAPYSWCACHILERIPFLRTHYLGVIRCAE